MIILLNLLKLKENLVLKWKEKEFGLMKEMMKQEVKI